VKHQCISVLAKTTLPFSGLSLSAGSGSMELKKVINENLWGELGRMPHESVDFFDGMLNLVIGVGRLNPQLENQSVELVYDECDLDTLLESMSDDLFSVDHELV
jgi:hypothetical protein